MSGQQNYPTKVFVIWLLTIGCLLTISKASKCDHSIIEAIKVNFWNNGYCIPQELLRNGAYMSPSAVVRATEGLYPDEQNLTCVSSEYYGSVIIIRTDYNNSNCPPQVTYVISATESDGYIYETSTGAYLYHLYTNRFGVTVFYRCEESGAVGDPEAIIKVSVRRGYDESAVLEACADLASIGIYVSSKVYNTSCAELLL